MEEYSESQENTTKLLVGFGLLLATSIIVLLGLLLVWFALLRENQAFWTNAAGYPILLRDLVQWTYVPLLLGTSIILFGLTLACFSKVCGSVRFFILEALVLLFCWGLLATSGFVAFRNNILNILHGTPLHQHDAF